MLKCMPIKPPNKLPNSNHNIISLQYILIAILYNQLTNKYNTKYKLNQIFKLCINLKLKLQLMITH
jgi:hypothetical protein